MSYSIVYSSQTGNTKQLAEAIQRLLPADECLYFGPPSPQALSAKLIYVGFWTDKGTCDRETAAFLSALTTQEVFLFGTAGFGGASAYFEDILARVKANLPHGVTLVGSYMCQGKMPPSVRHRYEAMEASPQRQAMLDNFDRALSHPDASDLDALAAALHSKP